MLLLPVLWLATLVAAGLEDVFFDDFGVYPRDRPLDSSLVLVSLVALASISLVSTAPPPGSGSLLDDLKGNGGNNPQEFQEFTPIRASISQLETQYYLFPVNTTSGFGQVYQFLIFLTGNICSEPANVHANETLLAVYYSFNLLMFLNFEIGEMSLFEYGYFQALAEVPVDQTEDDDDDDDFSNLYIAVRAPENTNSLASWLYQIGVSQNDLVFQWDDRPWAKVIDTDMDLALVVTGNLTSNSSLDALNVTDSKYSLLVFPADYQQRFANLNLSWCAIRNTVPLFDSLYLLTSYSRINGYLQQQFTVSGLNASTRYLAYLLSNFKGKDFGGAVYQPFEFETMSNDACRLIYDLEFCTQVAYSVPNNGGDRFALRDLYDDHALQLYTNFSYAMQQIACNTSDEARFSPVVNCADCEKAYRDWLCSVTIPRCSTRQLPFYVFRDRGDSRSDFINDVIKPKKPYYEILPCIDNCNNLARTCPAPLEFSCPVRNDLIAKSYYWFESGYDYPTCNFVGDHLTLKSSGWRLAANVWLLVLALAFIGI